MNCGQTASIPHSGQDESDQHGLPIQNHHVRRDGSTVTLGQVNILTASLSLAMKCGEWCPLHRGDELILRQMPVKRASRFPSGQQAAKRTEWPLEMIICVSALFHRPVVMMHYGRLRENFTAPYLHAKKAKKKKKVNDILQWYNEAALTSSCHHFLRHHCGNLPWCWWDDKGKRQTLV